MLGFSHIAWDLNQITRGGGKEKFVWVLSQQQAFDDLNQRLCSTLVLSLPNLQHPFEIKIDASNYVLGIVLSVITEISSAQGDKNSASSAQKNNHSWHKVKTLQHRKRAKTIQKWLKN